MNKPVFYIAFLFCFCASFGNAQQNLVYNGDFEEYSECPNTESYPQQGIKEIEKCVGWNAPTYGTSDYFNTCASGTNVSVPLNVLGEQYPYSGNGYLGGFFTSYTGGSGTDGYSGIMWWEYVQGTLVQPLESNKVYKLSMEVSLAEYSDLIIREFGAFFSPSAVSAHNSAALNLSPQCIYSRSDYFDDTVNWIHLETYFVAMGSEQFLVIGNFNDNVNTDTLRRYTWFPEPDPFVTYMYIDNVVLVDASDLVVFPNIFTPNNDGLNDFWLPFDGLPEEDVIILNRWGNVVQQGKLGSFTWDGLDLYGTECKEGTYFYIVGNKLFTGFIQLVR